MTHILLYAWMMRFDANIGEMTSRKVALLVNNCSEHGAVETIPALNNVVEIFLPPNSTSKIQPIDENIISSAKVRYRISQVDLEID